MCLLLGGLRVLKPLSKSGYDRDSDQGVDMKDGQHGSKNRTLNNGHHDCFTAICTYIHSLPAHPLSLIFVLQYSIEILHCWR